MQLKLSEGWQHVADRGQNFNSVFFDMQQKVSGRQQVTGVKN
jgi:hypothetical protein